eukprot:3772217-Amphidinium_carterae.1
MILNRYGQTDLHKRFTRVIVLQEFSASREAWKGFATTGDDPAVFVAEHTPMLWMLLPQAETEKVMGLATGISWKDYATEVRYIFNSSRLGQALMAGPIVAVTEVDVETVIEDELKKMGGASKVDDKVVASTLQGIAERLKSVAGVSSLFGRRKPHFTYRGVDIVLPVQSLEHHFECAVAVRLRQEAVLAKQIDALPAENDLCGGPTESTWKIADGLILGAKKARRLLLDKINEQGGKEKTEKKEKKEKDGNAVEAE